MKHRSDKGGTHAKAKKGDKRIGNNFNALRESFGTPKLFPTPEELWNLCIDYMEYCAENPLTRNDSIKSGDKAGQTFPVEMPRVYSIKGFASFLGVCKATLYNYEKHENYKEFHDTFARIKDIFDNNLLENALVGNYDQRLAAMRLGMTAKQEMKVIPQLHFDGDDKNL